MLANELAQRLREAIEDLLDMNLVDKRIGGVRKRNAGSWPIATGWNWNKEFRPFWSTV